MNWRRFIPSPIRRYLFRRTVRNLQRHPYATALVVEGVRHDIDDSGCVHLDTPLKLGQLFTLEIVLPGNASPITWPCKSTGPYPDLFVSGGQAWKVAP